MKNYYHILKLQNFASTHDIRRSYRKLALQHHPDRGGCQEKMKELNEAYEYLMKNKDQYDLQLRPSKPVLKRYGFTIVVNNFGYGFEMQMTNETTGSGWNY